MLPPGGTRVGRTLSSFINRFRRRSTSSLLTEINQWRRSQPVLLPLHICSSGPLVDFTEVEGDGRGYWKRLTVGALRNALEHIRICVPHCPATWLSLFRWRSHLGLFPRPLKGDG